MRRARGPGCRTPLARAPTRTPAAERPRAVLPTNETRPSRPKTATSFPPPRTHHVHSSSRVCGWPTRRSADVHDAPSRTQRARAPRLHARSALPHLQIGLGAVPQVVAQRLAAEPAQVGEPVGVQPVVRDAFRRVVERPRPRDLPVEGHAVVQALERVRQRARAGLLGEAAEVGAVAPPEHERRRLRPQGLSTRARTGPRWSGPARPARRASTAAASCPGPSSRAVR